MAVDRACAQTRFQLWSMCCKSGIARSSRFSPARVTLVLPRFSCSRRDTPRKPCQPAVGDLGLAEVISHSSPFSPLQMHQAAIRDPGIFLAEVQTAKPDKAFQV